MVKSCFLLAALFVCSAVFGQKIKTRFENSGGNETPDYFEIINWWTKLDDASGKVKMIPKGMTDAGFPLHVVMISNNGDSNPGEIRKKNKRIIFINNGIHPGEPDGIDASMMLARDIVEGKWKLPDNTVLAVIPVYNIGGCLNRSTDYRVDQNGPEAFGSRGNSQNLDLNRDFIKCDSKEARAFTEIFHWLDPDVFVDNHVSNGADYQHVMTLLTTQHNKLGGAMGAWLSGEFEPALYRDMKTKGFDLVPYVNHFGETPESGWSEFWDSPRYGSGYGALWNCFSFVPETHMLKPYDQRVRSTYALMQCFIDFTSANSEKIRSLREQAKRETMRSTSFPVRWELDRSKWRDVIFKGFEATKKPSEISGAPRLFYDRTKPYEKTIKVFNEYVVKESIDVPSAYVVPQGWWKVIELLQINGIRMRRLKKDTSIMVTVYKIEDYKTMPKAYEGHHLNSDVKYSSSKQILSFRKGDWLIPLDQPGNRFLVETLEPQGEDAYFAWNFFDPVLGQKEGYSAYVFEDIAAAYLKDNIPLQEEMKAKRLSDSVFAKDGRAQLNYVYQHSPWAEPGFMRYPVYRIERKNNY